jgi:hypothetical protein
VYVNGAFYTFTEWDALGVKDQNSLGAAPTFANVALTSISHYALATGSAGENAGSDGKDIGADVSLVGPQ